MRLDLISIRQLPARRKLAVSSISITSAWRRQRRMPAPAAACSKFHAPSASTPSRRNHALSKSAVVKDLPVGQAGRRRASRMRLGTAALSFCMYLPAAPQSLSGQRGCAGARYPRFLTPLRFAPTMRSRDPLHVVGPDGCSCARQMRAYTFERDVAEKPVVARQHQEEQETSVAGHTCGADALEKCLVFWRSQVERVVLFELAPHLVA